MTDRKILRLVENDPAAAAEVSTLIEQANAEPTLRDYRKRPPVDAPREIDGPSSSGLFWLIVAVAAGAVCWLLIGAACGLVTR